VEGCGVEGVCQDPDRLGAVARSKARQAKRHPESPEALENKVWLLFHRLGFSCLNERRQFKMQFGGPYRHYDVFAKHEDQVFVIDCASTTGAQPVNALNKLEGLVGRQSEIVRAVREQWPGERPRVSLLVVVGSEEKRERDEEFQRAHADRNLYLWSRREVVYFDDLARALGELRDAARYQLFSILFQDKRNKALEVEVPALRIRMGKVVFYSFGMSARELLKYAYVHHRALTGIVQRAEAYQRLLQRQRLRDIQTFLDASPKTFFANNVLLNFQSALNFARAGAAGDVQWGTLSLPGKYGSAWVVDGQHRLYGSALAEREIVLPVVAFERMSEADQARLFVEINDTQKPVPRDLLWDLYSDIYRASEDAEQQTRYLVAETAKRLCKVGPLKNRISVPSGQHGPEQPLSLATVCETIRRHSGWDRLTAAEPTETPSRAASVISAYWSALAELWPEEWARGPASLLLSNKGFGVFMMVFKDVVSHIHYYSDKEGWVRLSKSGREGELQSRFERYLSPVVEQMREEPKLAQHIRRAGGRGGEGECAGVLDLAIQKAIPTFSPVRIKDSPERVARGAVDTDRQRLHDAVELAEPELVGFVLTSLKGPPLGEAWRRGGLPQRLKKRMEEIAAANPGFSGEECFRRLALGDMTDVIVYGHNWANIFSETFLCGKEEVRARLSHLNGLRSALQHGRAPTQQEILDGLAALYWLSLCLERPALYPGAGARDEGSTG
jgi:DGQHR domain-containing protein